MLRPLPRSKSSSSSSKSSSRSSGSGGGGDWTGGLAWPSGPGHGQLFRRRLHPGAVQFAKVDPSVGTQFAPSLGTWFAPPVGTLFRAAVRAGFRRRSGSWSSRARSVPGRPVSTRGRSGQDLVGATPGGGSRRAGRDPGRDGGPGPVRGVAGPRAGPGARARAGSRRSRRVAGRCAVPASAAGGERFIVAVPVVPVLVVAVGSVGVRVRSGHRGDGRYEFGPSSRCATLVLDPVDGVVGPRIPIAARSRPRSSGRWWTPAGP